MASFRKNGLLLGRVHGSGFTVHRVRGCKKSGLISFDSDWVGGRDGVATVNTGERVKNSARPGWD
jgi:hypothetical protein